MSNYPYADGTFTYGEIGDLAWVLKILSDANPEAQMPLVLNVVNKHVMPQFSSEDELISYLKDGMTPYNIVIRLAQLLTSSRVSPEALDHWLLDCRDYYNVNTLGMGNLFKDTPWDSFDLKGVFAALSWWISCEHFSIDQVTGTEFNLLPRIAEALQPFCSDIGQNSYEQFHEILGKITSDLSRENLDPKFSPKYVVPVEIVSANLSVTHLISRVVNLATRCELHVNDVLHWVRREDVQLYHYIVEPTPLTHPVTQKRISGLCKLIENYVK